MTSNVGARMITEKQRAWASPTDGRSSPKRREDPRDRDGGAQKDVSAGILKPCGRHHCLQPADEDDIQEIANRMLNNFAGPCQGDWIFPPDLHRRGGGRNLQRRLRPGLRRASAAPRHCQRIEDPLSEQMLEGKVKAGQTLVCDYREEKFQFDAKADAAV